MAKDEPNMSEEAATAPVGEAPAEEKTVPPSRRRKSAARPRPLNRTPRKRRR